MKHHYLWAFSVCFFLFLACGCDDTSQTPRIKQEFMEFDRTGGTKVNEVALKKNPVSYTHLTLPTTPYV